MTEEEARQLHKITTTLAIMKEYVEAGATNEQIAQLQRSFYASENSPWLYEEAPKPKRKPKRKPKKREKPLPLFYRCLKKEMF